MSRPRSLAATPNLVLQSADASVIAVEDGALVAKQAGASAVLISTEDGAVVDFQHLWVAPVTKVTLARRDGDRIGGAIGLAVTCHYGGPCAKLHVTSDDAATEPGHADHRRPLRYPRRYCGSSHAIWLSVAAIT